MACSLGVPADVHRPDQAPLGAVRRGAELFRPLLHDVPVGAEHVEPASRGGSDGQQAAAELSGCPGTGRRDLGRHRHLGERPLVGQELQTGLDQLEPLGLHGDLLAGQQQEDGLKGLLHHVALLGRVDTHHEGVRGQGAGADPDHDPPARQVVQQHHAVGQHEGVVVGQRRHAGAQLDVLGALGRGGDEHLGRGDDLVAGRVVLTEPGLVEAQRIEVLDQLEVALEGEGRVLSHRVEGGQEDAELEVLGASQGGHVGGVLS